MGGSMYEQHAKKLRTTLQCYINIILQHESPDGEILLFSRTLYLTRAPFHRSEYIIILKIRMFRSVYFLSLLFSNNCATVVYRGRFKRVVVVVVVVILMMGLVVLYKHAFYMRQCTYTTARIYNNKYIRKEHTAGPPVIYEGTYV